MRVPRAARLMGIAVPMSYAGRESGKTDRPTIREELCKR
jgi:hypothetical protein